MSLSERLQSIHFNKGAIGYNIKEVDAFVAELRTAAERDESALRTLRAKLDAFEGRSAEITRTENEAYRLLAAAKDEAEKVRAAAEAQAKTMLEDAKVRAAAAEAVAAERASAAEREAARRANETVGNARQNAAMILAAADKRGREALAAAEREAADVRARTAALFRRSAEFEEKLRRLTADTVRALAALNASAPADATVAPAAAAAPASAPTAAPAETLSMPDPTPIFASRPRRTDRVRPAESAAAPAAASAICLIVCCSAMWLILSTCASSAAFGDGCSMWRMRRSAWVRRCSSSTVWYLTKKRKRRPQSERDPHCD